MKRPSPTLRVLLCSLVPRVIGSNSAARTSAGIGVPWLWTETAQDVSPTVRQALSEPCLREIQQVGDEVLRALGRAADPLDLS